SLVTTTGQKDFTPQLTELKNAGIDSLVLLNLYTDAALQIKQAKALGLDVPILVTASANNPELVNIAGAEAAEGTYVSAIFDPGSSNEGTQAFVKAFSDANGREPSEGAAVAYDSAWVVFRAFDEGAKDRESLISTIDGIESFDLPIVGEFVFNDKHEPTVTPGKPSQSLLQVQGGEIKTRPGA
ncbi:ABC transporter substrate-binding protein, partial [Aeromicrobium tamlense]